MRIPALAITATLSLGGCVIYDNNCEDQRFPLDDYDTGMEAEAPTFFLTPDVAEAGDTFIGSLMSDQAVNYEAVAELEFFGDVTICTRQAREDELLLTLQVDVMAEAGPVDALLTMEDGTNVFIPELLLITVDGNDGSTDGGSDDDGGSDGSGGGGADGGGSDDGSADGSDGSGGSDDGNSGGGC